MLTKSYFVEPLPIMLKLLEVCQETQTDIKELKQKVNSLENLVKKQVENPTMNAEKCSKNNDWIEVYIVFIIIFSYLLIIILSIILFK